MQLKLAPRTESCRLRTRPLAAIVHRPGMKPATGPGADAPEQQGEGEKVGEEAREEDVTLSVQAEAAEPLPAEENVSTEAMVERAAAKLGRGRRQIVLYTVSMNAILVRSRTPV